MLVACGMPGPDAVNDPLAYAKVFSRSHDAVIRVYDEAGNVIDTHEHTGEFGGGEVSRSA
jgi:hypothetical protein